MSEKLEFDLVVKNNSLDSSLDTATKKSGNLQSALNTALGVFAGGAALKGFGLLNEAIGSTVDFAKDSIDAAAKQEDAYNRLAQSLRATGDSSKASLDELINFSQELGDSSKQSGEAITQQVAYAKSLGATNKQTMDLVSAAAELSATFGGSLEQNVALLGKTLNGTSGKIGLLIPELKSLTAEQLAAGEAASVILEKFGGNAAAELETYSGRIHVLGNAYEDLQKQIGGMVVGSSDLNEGQGFLTTAIRTVTQAISDYRIESARLNGSIVETETTVDQLKRKYEETAVAFIDLEQKSINPTMWQYISGQAAYAKGELDNYKAAVDEAKAAFDAADFETKKGGYIEDPNAKPESNGGGRGLSEELLNARQKLNDEILALDQQLLVEQNNLDLESYNAKIENDALRQQEEIQRIMDFAATKAELEFQLKDQELIRTLDGEEQRLALLKSAGEKELALAKIKNDGLVKQANLGRETDKKLAAEKIGLQQATASTINGIIGTSANIATALTKDGSKEQFFIQKAAALAQAIVATHLALAQANAVPPPGNIPAMAAAQANGAIAISGIVASSLKGFQDGGFIGGEGQGATSGPDDTTFKGRKGELVLTAEDQSMLLNGIRSGSLGGGGEIVIQIGEEVVFRAVRNQMKKGYRLP